MPKRDHSSRQAIGHRTVDSGAHPTAKLEGSREREIVKHSRSHSPLLLVLGQQCPHTDWTAAEIEPFDWKEQEMLQTDRKH